MRNNKLSRRQFVKGGLGTVLGVAIARISSIFPEAHGASAGANHHVSQEVIPDVGELFAGFLLLAAETPLPESVQLPTQTLPIVCGIGAGRNGPEATAEGEQLTSNEELKSELDFEMYVWNDVPSGLRLQKPHLIRYPTGDVFHVALGIEQYNDESASWETIARISATPAIASPHPLWEASQDDLDDTNSNIGRLQKVDYLPVPGIMVQTVNGYVFHWIENSILYTLVTEEGLSLEESRQAVASLHK